MTATAKLIDILAADLGIPGTEVEAYARPLLDAGLMPDEGGGLDRPGGGPG